MNRYHVPLFPVQPTALAASLSGTQIWGLNYSYGTSGYNNGTIASISNALGASGRSATYSYDQLNRLASAQAGTLWGTTYGYDNWGNLTNMTPISGTTGFSPSLAVSVNTSNQLTASGYSYDADGRMTTDNFGNAYTYDAEGRILTVGGYTYTYDGDGERVEKSNSLTGRLYWPDLNGSAANETDLSGGTVVRNVYVGGTQVARQDSGGNWTYFLHDQLGTARIALTASGGVALDTDYFPFGGVAYSSGSSSDPYGFTGYETDSESSSNYAVFRNQSPSLGRFLRPDPYDGSYDQTNPQSFNRYAYVLNNPLSYIDPTGTDVVVCDGAGNCYTYSDDQWNQLMQNGPGGGTSVDDDGNIICADGSNCGSVTYTSNDGISVSGAPFSPVAPNNGRNCTPSPASAGQYAISAATMAGLTAEFFSGIGAQDRTFGADSSVSAVMGQSAGVQSV